MTEWSKIKKEIKSNDIHFSLTEFSNPLAEQNNEELALTHYTKSLPRQNHDEDVTRILEVVRILNNLVPIKMPEYNFNIDEINGERYYRPDGTLLLIREYDSDLIRDYYASSEQVENGYTVSRILEHEKLSGRLRTKIEPITRKGSRLKTNITIFDLKINNKYIIIQLSDDGIVNNISEFTGVGQSFQTLFRNIKTNKPARYLEGTDSKEHGFKMIDCLFDSEGKIVRIKRYSNKKEINIDYTQNSKNISVKTSK